MGLNEVIGAIFLALGVLFSTLGVVGLIRLPDTYSRLHASGKTSTLGVVFLCFAAGFIMPTAFPKVLALGLFIIFSGPVASHAIAAAVHRSEQLKREDEAAAAETETTEAHPPANGTPPLAADQV